MIRNNITKKDLRNKIHYTLGIPDRLSEEILNSFFDIIIEGLLKDGEVKISNFGKFKVLNKKSRIGRNPKTKVEFNISKRKVVAFYPSLSTKKNLMKNKSKEAYKTISEAAKEIGLINVKNNKPSTHTLRFWEKNFKQIKPKILFGNRRYYSNKDIDVLKLIYNLLKKQGMTISGAKKALNSDSIKLDPNILSDIKGENLKQEIKDKVSKIKTILEKIKKIK